MMILHGMVLKTISFIPNKVYILNHSFLKKRKNTINNFLELFLIIRSQKDAIMKLTISEGIICPNKT